MNNEPIQFLPVPCLTARKVPKSNRFFCLGMVFGSFITILSAWLIIFILSRL